MNGTIIYNIIDFYLISFYYYFTSRIVFRKRVYINYYTLLIFVICGVMFCLGKIMLCSLLIILPSFLVGFIYNKYTFKMKTCTSYLLSLISSFVLAFIVALFCVLFRFLGISFGGNYLLFLLAKMFYIGITMLITYVITWKVFEKINFSYRNFCYIIVIGIVICLALLVMVMIMVHENKVCLMLYLALIAMLLLGTLVVDYREKKNAAWGKRLIELYEYAKESDAVITEYRMALHESNNTLLAIKGMLGGDVDEIRDYVDNAIKKRRNITVPKDNFGALNYIPVPSIRYFLSGKICAMKDIGSSVELFISPEVVKIKDYVGMVDCWNDLYIVLGVVLDNVINSLKEAPDKLCSIQMYLENNILHFEFANTFNDTANVRKIAKTGYKTKNVNHGVGLSLVDEVLKKKKYYSLETDIVDNFFVQKLKIDLSKIKIK
mgnify:FL=1